jgi:leucyl aminopeptidase (aminopeptidase T)
VTGSYDEFEKGEKMKNILMSKGARTLVETCAAVKPEENVLIVTDFTKMKIAEAVSAAAYRLGAEVAICAIAPRTGHGQEPPPVAEDMKKADVVFMPVSYSITHTQAVKSACESGARIIAMTDFREDMLIKGGLEADFHETKILCQKMAQAFEKSRDVLLTSSGGTRLSMRKEGRPGNALHCIVEAGQMSPAPTVEANFSPIEGSAEGIIVADASIPYIDIGILFEPVQATVKEGMITDIKGGHQAKILADDLKRRNDPNVYNVAELGVGLNPKCTLQGIMLEDEGVFGTVHIGIGTNITLGGNIKAAIHYDLLMWEPTIELDGKVVLEKGQVRL